jgi:hypothetical protein
MNYLLMTLVCSHLSAECKWQFKGLFPSEEQCVMTALANDPNQEYRCQQDFEFVPPPSNIPFPKPRPHR